MTWRFWFPQTESVTPTPSAKLSDLDSKGGRTGELLRRSIGCSWALFWALETMSTPGQQARGTSRSEHTPHTARNRADPEWDAIDHHKEARGGRESLPQGTGSWILPQHKSTEATEDKGWITGLSKTTWENIPHSTWAQSGAPCLSGLGLLFPEGL